MSGGTVGSGGADITPPPPGFDPANPGPIGFGTPDGIELVNITWATVPTIGGAASVDLTGDGGTTVVLALGTYRCRLITFYGTPGAGVTIKMPVILTGTYAEWIIQNESDSPITVESNDGLTSVVINAGVRQLVVINAQHYVSPGHIFLIQ